ncbi:MAG: sigma-54-dependent Fis family transcriptional regulator [Pseudomonadota bacterium]
MPVELGYQLVVFSREEVRAFDLPARGEVTIGRDPSNQVHIDDPAVSRQHAILRLGEEVEIEDLGGANGTFIRQTAHGGSINDTLNMSTRPLLRRKATLLVGDCLLFGAACVVLRRAPAIEIPDLAPGVVVRDRIMQTLYADAARVARAQINVLLLGETGVGKEVLARAIHSHSARAKGPFMGVNCAALAESLLESELFGSEKGAFTGALTRAGLFEAANGGTVFLDEVGELPLGTQAKLLRVLEERVVTRLGATRPRAIDVRIVAATNRDLEADSRQGRLRSDLYFRLNGVALVIPPLRERPGDIEALAGSFLSGACRDLERVPPLVFRADPSTAQPTRLARQRPRAAQRRRTRRRDVHRAHDPARAPASVTAGRSSDCQNANPERGCASGHRRSRAAQSSSRAPQSSGRDEGHRAQSDPRRHGALRWQSK